MKIDNTYNSILNSLENRLDYLYEEYENTGKISTLIEYNTYRKIIVYDFGGTIKISQKTKQHKVGGIRLYDKH